jgi:hypothetical protein
LKKLLRKVLNGGDESKAAEGYDFRIFKVVSELGNSLQRHIVLAKSQGVRDPIEVERKFFVM